MGAAIQWPSYIPVHMQVWVWAGYIAGSQALISWKGSGWDPPRGWQSGHLHMLSKSAPWKQENGGKRESTEHTSTLRLKSQSLWYNIPIHAAQLLKIGTNYKVLSCSQEKYVLTVMFVHNPSCQTWQKLFYKLMEWSYHLSKFTHQVEHLLAIKGAAAFSMLNRSLKWLEAGEGPIPTIETCMSCTS